MKKLILIGSIAAASIAAAPAKQSAVASSQAGVSDTQQLSDGGTATPPGPAAEEKKICKLLPTSGTRMAKRACLTAKEWQQLQAQLDKDEF